MKFKKATAIMLCAATLVSAPYVPVLSETTQSVSITAEAADTRTGSFTVGMLTFTTYKDSAGTNYAVLTNTAASLQTLTLGATITYNNVSYPIRKIAGLAVSSKKSLATVDLSKATNLREIGAKAFINSTVRNVYIGSTSNVVIKEDAFTNTPYLNTVQFKAGTGKVTICENAFNYSSLLDLNCSATTIVIETNAFGTADLSRGNHHSQLKTVYFGKETKNITLGHQLFEGFRNLSTVSVGNSSANLTLEGSRTFCNSTVSIVTLPSTLTSIPNETLYRCSNLKSCTIPNSVTKIGDYAFSESGLIGVIEIGANVTTIGTNAFKNMKNLRAFRVSTSNSKYKSDTHGALYNKSGTTLITYPAGSPFTSYTLTAKYIQDYAFEGAEYLKHLDLTNMVTRPNGFGVPSRLESLTIPKYDSYQSGGVIFERYDDFMRGSSFHKINGQELCQVASDGKPYFLEQYADYIKANFENYTYTEFMKQYVQKMAAYVVKNETTDDMTDMEKAIKLHDWILNYATYDPAVIGAYDYDDPDPLLIAKYHNGKDHVDASVFLHEGDGVNYTVCEGYAKCYNILLREAGVESYYVSGSTSSPIGHAWNLVKINGNYYHVDVCWDDSNYDDTSNYETYKYRYFMKADSAFNSDEHSKYNWSASGDPTGTLRKSARTSTTSLSCIGNVMPYSPVDGNDVNRLQAIVNGATPTAYEKVAGDLDFDGDIDNKDLSMLKEYRAKYTSFGSPWKWVMAYYNPILKQLSNVCVANGATAKATVVAEDTIVKYEWYYKNANMTSFAKTTSFTGKTYSVTMNSTRNNRQIYCVLTDDKGNKFQTNTITLSMK